MSRAPIRAALAASAAFAAAFAASAASASDEKLFAELKAKYEKAAKVQDDTGIRERRRLILGFFDFRDLKACRKQLRDILEDESAVDTRVATVQVLGATGDSKDVEFVLKALAKERLRGPSIALGEALSYTAKESAAAVSAHAAGLVAKAKGDLRFALLEGVAELGDPAAYPALAALSEKLTPEERYIHDVARGACGKEQAIDALAADVKAGNATVRLGGVVGLAKTGSPLALPHLVGALHDLDPRVVEAAATALGEAKHQPAAEPMVDALATAPLRVRWVLRAALAAIVGKDHGLSADAWRDALAGKTPEPPVVAPPEPKQPHFFGVPVVSDRVAIVLDNSHSMAWNGRLARAQEGIAEYLVSLDDAASFAVFTCASSTETFAKGMSAGKASRTQAIAWVRKQLGGSGFDLKRTLLTILAQEPDVDTILFAGDSLPWGEGSAESCTEVIEIFRRANMTRRVRVHAAFVVPGGRVATQGSEQLEDEFEQRAEMLQLLAETSGGKFVRLDK